MLRWFSLEEPVKCSKTQFSKPKCLGHPARSTRLDWPITNSSNSTENGAGPIAAKILKIALLLPVDERSPTLWTTDFVDIWSFQDVPLSSKLLHPSVFVFGNESGEDYEYKYFESLAELTLHRGKTFACNSISEFQEELTLQT